MPDIYRGAGGGGSGGKIRERERERESASGQLGPSFYMFSAPGPALCRVGSARSAVLPEVLTPVLGPFFDLPLLYFHRLSLPCLLATTILD